MSDCESRPRTLVEKIIDAHTITMRPGRSLIYLDRIITADTSRPIYQLLESSGHRVRRPNQTLFIPDHYTPSRGMSPLDAADPESWRAIVETQDYSSREGLQMFPMGDPRRGIQHTVSIEHGFALPGLTVAATDSHTLTQGAVGAIALSISADMVHALATQTLWLKIPGQMRIVLEGRCKPGVTAKDVALLLLARLGPRGAAGMAVEYCGSHVRALGIGGRMTLCNLATELGARAAIIAPDDITYDALAGATFAPKDAAWDQFRAERLQLRSDEDASWSRSVTLDVGEVAPMVSWGTSPAQAVPVTGHVPDPRNEPDPLRRSKMTEALSYMGLVPGTEIRDLQIDQVFIGSCANGHIQDLKEAAAILKGRRVRVPTLVVPGSGHVGAEAEALGLVDTFRAAGAVWGESGCSMCNSMNGDIVRPGLRCASTSNRNHMGRQGPGSRTHLVSPAMAAAAAVAGRFHDIRDLSELP
ncbi:3-isopropylmalate dehydratase large subunit [Microvirga tunisiensis]|uniref:3-isopropylmalate dehydratase n=1 Tax=Microvirga tunisiensis TaxID=2108360 RepID=A0A5N7MHV6_9HYPH|nr:3-isopropylmalate dehydratase large subunit [Microvirga tunisiensis]MPR10343.1 3-isopropylmalate dehydratase large subunit [Microvirga tunisiensis]MPR25989.1 3-isopropylmalate dehydratase large subunit [Microvirga tunisiensis]